MFRNLFGGGLSSAPESGDGDSFGSRRTLLPVSSSGDHVFPEEDSLGEVTRGGDGINYGAPKRRRAPGASSPVFSSSDDDGKTDAIRIEVPGSSSHQSAHASSSTAKPKGRHHRFQEPKRDHLQINF